MKKILTAVTAVSLLAALTACNSTKEITNSSDSESVPTNSSPQTSLEAKALFNAHISDDDIKSVKSVYKNDNRSVIDTALIDLDFDGKDELLVLTHQANPRVFESWKKEDGIMCFDCSFGAGKLNYVEKITLVKSKLNGEQIYLFSFGCDEGAMKADEVLSAVRKTADGYEIEYLLSRGTITYSDIAEPFSKDFFRKGWSKYEIGMDDNANDISKEEYTALYDEYTKTAADVLSPDGASKI